MEKDGWSPEQSVKDSSERQGYQSTRCPRLKTKFKNKINSEDESEGTFFLNLEKEK